MCVPASAQNPYASQCSGAVDVRVLASEQTLAAHTPLAGSRQERANRNHAIPASPRVSRLSCYVKWYCYHGAACTAEQKFPFPYISPHAIYGNADCCPAVQAAP